MSRSLPAWTLSAILALSASTVEASRPIDVYLIAGQSNATGQGRLANLPSGFVPDISVLIYQSPYLKNDAPPLTWLPLRAASEAPDKFGVELSFGGRIRQLTGDRPVALIKHAHTATNLHDAWRPGKSADDPSDWGMMYQALVGTVLAGLKDLRDRGFDPTIRGMLWLQGESDSETREAALAYGANLRHFIARVREQFACPDLVFVHGHVMPPPCRFEWRDTIREAQAAVDQDSGSPLAVKNAFLVPTDDLTQRAQDPNTTDPEDHIHFGTAGVLELGRRMAETMAKKGKLAR